MEKISHKTNQNNIKYIHTHIYTYTYFHHMKIIILVADTSTLKQTNKQAKEKKQNLYVDERLKTKP